MSSLIPLTLAATIGVAAPTTSQAQIYIWDSQGIPIADWVYDNVGVRPFADGTDRMFGVWRNGFDKNVSFFYESTDCTGPRLYFGGNSATSQQLVQNAYYEFTASPGSKGKTFWAIPDDSVSTPHKYGSVWQGHESLGDTPGCSPGDGNSYYMTPMIPVDVQDLGLSQPPFCIATVFWKCAIRHQ